MTEENWKLIHQEKSGISIIKVHGYFNEETGKRLNEIVSELVDYDKLNFIIDFQECELINSLGVGALLELTLKVREDFEGKVVLASPTKLLLEVFELAFLIPENEVADGIEHALELF